MMRHKRGAILAGGLAVLTVAAWQLAPLRAQQAGPAPTRFEFQVVESFDSKYLGDTPGHIGRGGRLATGQPNVALGDPVYHDDRMIGKVTSLLWDRTKESLEVEFDPEAFEMDANGLAVGPNRVAIGELVWIPLGGAAGAKKAR